ncbi:MAG: hypothetical protein U0640_09435 [Phycisphaerales bacterium]
MSEQAKQEHVSEQLAEVGVVAELEGKLAATEAALERIKIEREVDAALLMNGAADLETARLLVEKHLNSQPAAGEQADIKVRVKAAVAEVRKRQAYLFPEGRGGIVRGATGAAKPKPLGESEVEKAAMRALQSGDRRSVTDYMRVKRGGQ